MTTTEPPPEQTLADPRSPRRVALVALSTVVALGAVWAVVVAVGGDEPAAAAPFSQVEKSCGDWMDSAPAGAETDDQWCTDMFAWMSNKSGGSMMGNMMWQGSEEMGRACRAWVADERGGTGSAGVQQCDAMLSWMDGHMSSQGGRWMMSGR